VWPPVDDEALARVPVERGTEAKLAVVELQIWRLEGRERENVKYPIHGDR